MIYRCYHSPFFFFFTFTVQNLLGSMIDALSHILESFKINWNETETISENDGIRSRAHLSTTYWDPHPAGQDTTTNTLPYHKYK